MDFGLIKTRQFWNAALSASARGLDNFVVSNVWNNLNITYLVISRNEIGYGMKRPGPCELMRANYWLKCQLLLSLHCHPPELPSRPLLWPWLCLAELPSDFTVFFLFHIFPCIFRSADVYGSDLKNFRPCKMLFSCTFWQTPHYFYINISK